MLAPREKLWAAPPAVVEAALDLAAAAPGETVCDIGCGDGVALFSAAARGCHALGVEVHAERVAALQARLATHEHRDSITVVCGNALEVDFSALGRRIDVVYLYLIERGLKLVLPALQALAAAQGTPLRVVTVLYKFPVPEAPGLALVARSKVRAHTQSSTSASATVESSYPLFLYSVGGGGGGGSSESSGGSGGSGGNGAESEAAVVSEGAH